MDWQELTVLVAIFAAMLYLAWSAFGQRCAKACGGCQQPSTDSATRRALPMLQQVPRSQN